MSVFCFGSRPISDEQLFDGIRNKSLNHIKEAINGGANVNARDDNGNTPLHNAVKLQYVELVLLLLNNGANVNAQNERSSTPLNVAIFKNNFDIALILLDRGAFVNSNDENGLTPLHKAVNLNREDIASLLLDRGAVVNAEDENGFTPMHIAVNRYSGDLGVIRLLLNREADVNARNKIKWTPLHEALNQSKFDLASMLLNKGADVNAENDKGNTPLNLFLPRAWNANPKLLISLIPESDKLNKWNESNLTNLIRVCLGVSPNNYDQIIALYSQPSIEKFLIEGVIFHLGNVANNESSDDKMRVKKILEKTELLRMDSLSSIFKYFQSHLNHVCRALSAMYPVLKARSSVPDYQSDVSLMDEYNVAFMFCKNEVRSYFVSRRVKRAISAMLRKTFNEEMYRRIFHDALEQSEKPDRVEEQGPFRRLPTELWFKIFEMSLGLVLDRELGRYDAFLSLVLENSSDDQTIYEFSSKFVLWISEKELLDVLVLMPGEDPGSNYVRITD